jgi:hypothetical protein
MEASAVLALECVDAAQLVVEDTSSATPRNLVGVLAHMVPKGARAKPKELEDAIHA